MSMARADSRAALEVALTDQMNRQISFYSLEDPTSGPVKTGSWTPKECDGYREIERYCYPSDVRLRYHEQLKTQVLLTCASHGFCAMAEYPSGRCLWNEIVEIADNPHAIELLPNGCIVIAASTGNYIRIYPADGAADRAATVVLMDAHGLLWDPEYEVLWAVGKSRLTAYDFAGTPEKPELTERTDLRAALPIAAGHDVWPVYGDPNRLWIVAHAIFQYDKAEKKWIHDFEGADLLQGENIKSVARSADGTHIRTTPNGTFQDWNTNVLSVLYAGDSELSDYTFPDAAFYRARIWSDKYQ